MHLTCRAFTDHKAALVNDAPYATHLLGAVDKRRGGLGMVGG